ncbi:MAG: POTRA domain-containing protein [Myxococcota bacterium]
MISLLAAVLLAQPAPGRGTVTAVELRLPTTADPALVEDAPGLVAVRKGQRLSLRAVRRSIDLLIATGRFADVVVRAVEAEGGVTVRFDLTPKQRLAVVRVRGNQALTEGQVLAAARLGKDEEYYPERVREAIEAVEAAYHRRGYEQARAEAELADLVDGLEVVLKVHEGEPTRLLAVTVSGGPGLPLPRLLSALGLSTGEVLDREVLEAGLSRLRALYRQERFYRARVGEPVVQPGGGGAHLFVPVFAGPRYEVRFFGNRSFSDALLRGVLAYDASETMDRALVGRLARRLLAFYRFQGFHDVHVEPREARSRNGQHAVLRFLIEEGRPLFVREVVFEGNQAVESAELKRLLTEVVQAKTPRPVGDVVSSDDPLQLEGRVHKSAHAVAPASDPRTVFVDSAYREAAEAMTSLYRTRGFLEAQVSLSNVDIDISAGVAVVRFEVEEGRRALVQEVSLAGAPEGFSGWTSRFEVGAPFTEDVAEEDRRSLERALGRSGYLFAHVEAAPNVDLTGTQVAVRYQVSPGPQIRVGKVVLRGLTRTDERVVRSQLEVREGEVLDPEALFTSERNLGQLGAFRTVTVRLIAPEVVEPTKDVVVEAKEAPRVSGEIAAGYYLAEGPRLVVDWAYPNAFGKGINISGRGKVHYFGFSGPALSEQTDIVDLQGLELFGGRKTVSLQNRGLLPADIGVRLDLLPFERVHRRSYRFTRFAAVPGLDWETQVTVPKVDWAKLRIGLSFQWELEHVRVFATGEGGQLLLTLARADQERLRFEPGVYSLHSARFGPTFDLRDDPLNPRRGALLQLSAERTWDLFVQDVNESSFPVQTLKASGTLTTYFPLGSRVVLALSARGGRIFSLHPHSKTIPPKRFFLGGAASMRGFREDGVMPTDRRNILAMEEQACRALANPVGCTPAARTLLSGDEVPSEGGELFTLGKAELRFPALGALDMGLFFEAGNLWLAPQNFEWTDQRYVAGTGLRYVTPIGPLAVDVGVNLVPDEAVNEPTIDFGGLKLGLMVHFNIGLF